MYVDFSSFEAYVRAAVSLLLVSIVKVYLGGLRPNFLARCFAPTGIPDPLLLANATAHGFMGVYYDTSVSSYSLSTAG